MSEEKDMVEYEVIEEGIVKDDDDDDIPPLVEFDKDDNLRPVMVYDVDVDASISEALGQINEDEGIVEDTVLEENDWGDDIKDISVSEALKHFVIFNAEGKTFPFQKQ